ncbi:hypothetical protein GOODEAATRI_006014 [Goodea atripinnis]|uniref:Laminin subunit gamma-2 n=1 Tax=Goodea atripinnis TaxID=208336 RepID=A0ABV0MZ19_9TELE
MWSSWISLGGILAAVCSVQTTYTFYSKVRCECNGRARYCLQDASGLRCVDCRGNTEGRHCERCKDGFYQQGAGLSCTPCSCNPTGSVGDICDSRGRCSCKEGVTGDKCERCPDGPIGPNGCRQRRQEREDSGSLTLPCFCYGHSEQCSAQPGYSIYNISSTFSTGPEGWTVGTVQGMTPQDVLFRWTPKHQDLEVISKQSLPAYLQAPDVYLGNKLLSYGQNFSFSLRLDRGVRYPSTNDVILEGAGLRVAASLGDLRSIVPCGKKISYTFRLDEQLGSRWRPQLSSSEFQKLLQNLTAIKIRATFGENGRGYLDNVNLVSARRGDGVPASWVQTCRCPPGYEGDFCERCSAGFRRRVPSAGPFSGCEPCSCRGGSCDPQTGDCYSADETPGEQSCSEGFYRDPMQQGDCVRCPCPERTSCFLAAGALEPQCLRCPPGTIGFYCDTCREGFYGDPVGLLGVQRPCRPCNCNGHIDVGTAGSCDRSSGECLRCSNNTTGRFCENCLRGFYHNRSIDACKPCNCDIQGSEYDQCDDSGQCRCRPGFEGLRCDRPNCPTCFSPIQKKMDGYAAKLKELEILVSESGRVVTHQEIEAVLRTMEELVNNLQENSKQLTETEKILQGRLSSISSSQLTAGQEIQNISEISNHIRQRQQTFRSKVEEVETLMDEMRRQLEEARTKLQSAELPLLDDPQSSGSLSSLAQLATELAEKHKTTADSVEQTANKALSDSKESLALVRTLMTRENKVKELIGDLQTLYDQTSADVKSLEKRAGGLSDEAKQESKMADSMLKDISRLEKNLPPSMKGDVDAMVTRLDGLKEAVQRNISAVEDLLDAVEEDRTIAEDLLDKGKTAQQEFNKLLDRVNDAKTETEKVLQSIRTNNDDLDNTLNTLRGFDQQISDSKALADGAIKRLPSINSTIQEAVRINGETQSALDKASKDYNNAMGTISILDNLANSLEKAVGSLPPYEGLVDEASRLNKEAKDLESRAKQTSEDLEEELKEADRLAADAEEAAAGATSALINAKQSRTAVQEMLRVINTMLANLNNSTPVDEEQLRKLEETLAKAEKDVEGRLRPRLQDMEEQEEAHRRRLTAINLDIDSVLADIANLEDILRTIPSGCFTNPPIEEA